MQQPVSTNELEHQPASPPQAAASNIIRPHLNTYPTQKKKKNIIRLQTTVIDCLPAVSFIFLTINAVAAAYRSRHDPSALAFVAFAYSDLAFLLVCLKRLEKLSPESPAEAKERLMAAVWVLAAALSLGFAWRVAEIMPPVLAVVVWLMTGLVVVGGFYGLFIYQGANDDDVMENRELSPEEKV